MHDAVSACIIKIYFVGLVLMDASDYKQQADSHTEAIQTRLQKPGLDYNDIVNFILEHKADYPRCFMRTASGPILRNVKLTFDSTYNPTGYAIQAYWQPDSDVKVCSVCSSSNKTQFGFWHSRHHCRYCGQVVCAACSQQSRMLPTLHTLTQEKVRICDTCVPLYDDLEGEMLFQHIKLYALFSALLTAAQSNNHLFITLIKERQLFFNSNDFIRILGLSLNSQCLVLSILGLHPKVIIDFSNDTNSASEITKRLTSLEYKDDKTTELIINALYENKVGLEHYQQFNETAYTDHQQFAEIIQALWQQNPHHPPQIKQRLHILLCLRAYWQCGELYQTQPWPSLLTMRKSLWLSLMQNHLTDEIQHNFADIASEENTLALQHSSCQWLLAHPECRPTAWQGCFKEPWLWQLPALLLHPSCYDNPENLIIFKVVLSRSDYDPNYQMEETEFFLLYRVLGLPGDTGFEYFKSIINKEGLDITLSLGTETPLAALLGPFIELDRRCSFDYTQQKLELLLEKDQKHVLREGFSSTIEAANNFSSFLQFMIEAIHLAKSTQKETDFTIDDYPLLQKLTVEQKINLQHPDCLVIFAAETFSAWYAMAEKHVPDIIPNIDWIKPPSHDSETK